MIETAQSGDTKDLLVIDVVREPICVGPYDTLREAVTKMGRNNLTTLPVVRNSDGKLMGLIQIADLLHARTKAGLRESERERVMRPRWPFGRAQAADLVTRVAELDGEVVEGSDDLIPSRDFREKENGSS
jgi:CBS domain-containing protein